MPPTSTPVLQECAVELIVGNFGPYTKRLALGVQYAEVCIAG